MTGLILLALIGIGVAYAWTRLRSRMKLSVSTKNWVGPIVIVVLAGALLWATHVSGGH